MNCYIKSGRLNLQISFHESKSPFLRLILIICMGISLVSCEPAEKNVKDLQEFYNIKMGEDSFLIPVDYLVDSRNRIDASEVQKIKVPENNRDGRYTPHNYVILMGQLPDMLPIEDGRYYSRSPSLSQKNIGFNMAHNPGGSYVGNNNLIRSAAAENDNVKVPDLLTHKDGWVNIGYDDKPKGMYENLYIYIRSHKPLAYIRCGRKPEQVSPGCWAYVAYNETISLNVIFLTENLDWFLKQGGIDSILGRIKSWEEKR